MGRLDDAERRRRLENVLTTLNQRPGRVSQESVQRLARKLGMEMYSETTETHELMTLAGGVYAVDVSTASKAWENSLMLKSSCSSNPTVRLSLTMSSYISMVYKTL